MEHILKDWNNTFRFLFIIVILFIIGLIIIEKISTEGQVFIDFKNDKTLISFISKQNVGASSVLPACDCWTNTGIEIRPDEEYEIKVSGKVHTAADKIIKDAVGDNRPEFEWVGPDGTKVFRIRNNKLFKLSDSLRKNLLLSQKANLGQVIFYFQKNSFSKSPNCELGLNFFNPDSTFTYQTNKDGLKGKNYTNEKWFVWASVNDMLIRNFNNKDDKIAYIGGSKYSEILKKKEEHWTQLAKENYNRIWFDDNFGNFVISAKITKPKRFFDFW